MAQSNETPTFANRLLDIYTGSMLTNMLDIGYRTGLFEAAAHGPATSEELSERAGLNERYVREWLGALAFSPTTRPRAPMACPRNTRPR